MNIYIMQKSITDIKKPVLKKEYETFAITVEDFISEMVIRNFKRKKESIDYIAIFDELISLNSERFAYEKKYITNFSLDDMIEFALTAFKDKIYLIKNVTKNIQYDNLTDDMNLSQNDEIVLIKLKYMRGAI